jgi:hypothetical protein
VPIKCHYNNVDGYYVENITLRVHAPPLLYRAMSKAVKIHIFQTTKVEIPLLNKEEVDFLSPVVSPNFTTI